MPTAFRPERLLVPLITPFDDAGRVDEAALERHADDVLDAGAAGLVAVATTGEATALNDDERATVTAICAHACAARDAVLVVGAGTYNTQETIARHEALADVPGVRASLAVVPYYVRPSEAAIVAHFQAVAARSPVPLIVSTIPFPLTVMGGAGAIAASANVATERYAAMIEAGLAGQVADGRPLAEALLPLTLTLFAEPSPAVIKAVLYAQGKIPTPNVRMPLADASPVAREQALAVLDALTVTA
jgi:4-hydroxy-tetrahydrodipicolinate synthase